VGVGGHRGLLGSAMGLEIVSLSTDELERLKLDFRFLLIESVSRVNEKARELLVLGVLAALPRGGVFSPMGTRSSTSLMERFSDLIVSSPSMVAPVGSVWSRALALHGGSRRSTHSCCYLFIGSAWGAGESQSSCAVVAVVAVWGADVGQHLQLRRAKGAIGINAASQGVLIVKRQEAVNKVRVHEAQ
jgi:hypothetical protein